MEEEEDDGVASFAVPLKSLRDELCKSLALSGPAWRTILEAERRCERVLALDWIAGGASALLSGPPAVLNFDKSAFLDGLWRLPPSSSLWSSKALTESSLPDGRTCLLDDV